MNIIKRIKEWISPTQKHNNEIYIDFRKLRQRELEQEFNMINNYVDLRYVFERIPYRWEDHIDKCVQYDEILLLICCTGAKCVNSHLRHMGLIVI